MMAEDDMSVRARAPRCPSCALQWRPGSCIYVPRRASGPPQALPEECSSMARAPVSKTDWARLTLFCSVPPCVDLSVKVASDRGPSTSPYLCVPPSWVAKW